MARHVCGGRQTIKEKHTLIWYCIIVALGFVCSLVQELTLNEKKKHTESDLIGFPWNTAAAAAQPNAEYEFTFN